MSPSTCPPSPSFSGYSYLPYNTAYSVLCPSAGSELTPANHSQTRSEIPISMRRSKCHIPTPRWSPYLNRCPFPTVCIYSVSCPSVGSELTPANHFQTRSEIFMCMHRSKCQIPTPRRSPYPNCRPLPTVCIYSVLCSSAGSEITPANHFQTLSEIPMRMRPSKFYIPTPRWSPYPNRRLFPTVCRARLDSQIHYLT